MTTPPEFTSLRRILFRLEGVIVPVPDGTRLGPITWTLERGRRVRVRCERPAQWEAFVELLTGRLAPAAGVLEEVATVRVQTDAHIRETLRLNQTLQDYLHSPDAPERVWLQGRRRSLWVLLDALGITPAMTRRAIKLLPPPVQEKFWALRFLVSRADLLIGRDVFALEDPQVRGAIARRWQDLPGTVVAGDTGAPLPGPVDSWVAFDAQGAFSSGAPGQPLAEPSPEEG